MPGKKYGCGCGKCDSSSTYCPSSSSSMCSSSSSSTYIKCKKKKSPKYCPNPYMRNSYEPCYPVPCPPNPYSCPPYPCPPSPYNPCNPCNPCNNPKTYNPFQYPNYTIYSSTGNIVISAVASQSYYIYVSVPGSSTNNSVTLPLINSLDCSKKRNFVISNSGVANISIIPSASGSTYDLINGQDVGSVGYELLPGCSVQVYSDPTSMATPNWVLIGCV